MIVLAFLPYALFPTWSTAVLGAPQKPTARGHAFVGVVTALSIAGWWAFQQELGRLGYHF
jgi:hypothetical protein